jgi:hypothetical protein
MQTDEQQNFYQLHESTPLVVAEVLKCQPELQSTQSLLGRGPRGEPSCLNGKILSFRFWSWSYILVLLQSCWCWCWRSIRISAFICFLIFIYGLYSFQTKFFYIIVLEIRSSFGTDSLLRGPILLKSSLHDVNVKMLILKYMFYL